jgi:hypothetical protein
LVESLWSTGGGHSQRRFQEGVGENRPSLGVGKAADHRRSHRPTQGHLRSGAPQGQDASRSFGPLGSQDRGLHLRAAAQRPTRRTAAPPSRPFGLSSYASLVLEVRTCQRRFLPPRRRPEVSSRVFRSTKPSQTRAASKGRLARGIGTSATIAPSNRNQEALRGYTRARTVLAASSNQPRASSTKSNGSQTCRMPDRGYL